MALSSIEPLTTRSSDFGRGTARWLTLGNTQKDQLLFCAANGFTAASYHFFLSRFARDYHINAVENRGVWPAAVSPKNFSWRDHAGDVDAFMSSRFDEPIVGIGHSMGATVCVLAAAKQPQLFKRLVLIDPATVPFRAMQCLPYSVMNRIPVVKSTLARTRQWPDKQAFCDYLRSKPAFKDFADEALNDYAEGGLTPLNDNVGLAFSPAWEAHNFCHAHYLWSSLARLKIPVLLLRAERSYVYSAARFEKKTQKLPDNIVCQTIPGVGHLAPQENPDLAERIIREWLAC